MPQDTIKAVRATMALDRAAYDKRLKDMDEMVKWCCARLKNAPSQATIDAQPIPPVVVPPPVPPVILPPPPPPITPDTAVTVSTTAELVSAIYAATPGLNIRLRPGTYAGFGLGGVNAPGITITSADPNDKAILTNFSFFTVSGITFGNVVFFANEPTGYWAFQWWDCTNVWARGTLIRGAGSDPTSGNQEGLGIYRSVNCGAVGCEFRVLLRAFTAGRCTNLTFTDNYVHNIQVTALMCEQIDGGSFDRNYITEFHVIANDHPDGLQVFTDNSDGPSRNLTFRKNLMTKGTGNIGAQGIFLTVNAQHSYPYENTTISDNMMIGTGYNGIALGGQGVPAFNGLAITGNELRSADADQLKTWIALGDGSNVTITGNKAIQIQINGTISNLTNTGNTVNAPDTAGDAAAQAAWLAAHPDFTAHTLSL